MDSEKRRAVVTGAGSGIGAATAAMLARDNWLVAALDRDGAAAARTARTLGTGHIAIEVDVSDEAGVIAAFDKVLTDFGRIDGLATCAGVLDTTPFLELGASTFRRLYDVNVVGTFLCMREAGKRMARGGRICAVSSVAGLRGGGLMGTAAYAATKGAVLALTKNAARSLADRGIGVNCVAPGSTETPMIEPGIADPAQRERIENLVPLKRLGTPEEIAAAIAWLLSPASSYVNGATLVVDGGMVMY